MNNSKQDSLKATKTNILKIIKSIKYDTIFTYNLFRKIENKNALRSIMSRLGKEGLIVKLDDGNFYRPKDRSLIKPSVKEWAIDKTLFVHDHFWSVSQGKKVNIDQLISTYVLHLNKDDIYTLYRLFGYKRVRATLEKSFKSYKLEDEGVVRHHPNYKPVLSILMEFEKERFYDRCS